ncbi:MAG: putative inorganic carbon transporter subunit DabA, partial [Haloarculaceae archaeon]
YQGNGGDLMAGLPLQSLFAAHDEPHHQPLRLSTVVHAPVERVTDVLAENEDLTQLLDNDWLSLTVVDPTQDHRAVHYEEELEWTPVSERVEARPATATTPAAADD